MYVYELNHMMYGVWFMHLHIIEFVRSKATTYDFLMRHIILRIR